MSVDIKIYLVTHKCMYTNSLVNICPLLRSRSQCSGTSCNLRLIRGADVYKAIKAAKHRGHYRFYIITNYLPLKQHHPTVVRANSTLILLSRSDSLSSRHLILFLTLHGLHDPSFTMAILSWTPQ